MLEIIHSFPEQIKESLELGRHAKISLPKNIIICGMGDSGFAGSLIKDLAKDCKVPITIVKDYNLPGWANQDSLVFCISYSGNTEEVISCFRDGLKRKSQIILLTTNGKLTILAQKTDVYNVIKLPYNLQPKTALAYMTFPILLILASSNLITLSIKELTQAIDSLKKQGYDEKAQELAVQLKGKIPLIYASQNYESVILRWKQSFNETSKIHAFCNTFPELDHNELMGYKRNYKDFIVIILSDEAESEQIRKRIKMTKEVIKQAGNSVIEISIKGESRLVKILTAIYLGDLTSYYLAKLYNTDPLEIDLIEEIKKRI